MTQFGYLVILQFYENTQYTSNEPIYLYFEFFYLIPTCKTIIIPTILKSFSEYQILNTGHVIKKKSLCKIILLSWFSKELSVIMLFFKMYHTYLLYLQT